MATALVSALSGRKVRKDIAMTGELTLTGRVLPIGGLKEKVLGAVRAGIREIILPLDNEADIEDIPAEVQETLTFHLVETLDEVVGVALTGEQAKGKKAPKKQRRKVATMDEEARAP
jgi:ATP-dependent Lon protease